MVRSVRYNQVVSDEPVMTATQVAQVFGVSRWAVSRWAKAGKLPAFRTPGGALRFRREDVDAFMVPDDEKAAS